MTTDSDIFLQTPREKLCMTGGIVRRGDRVTLRVLEQDDFDILQRGGADPSLRHLAGNSKVRNRSQIEEIYDDEAVTVFVVTLADDADPGPVNSTEVQRIGIASVKEWGRNPSVGIWILPEMQSKGYGTEASVLLVDYAFNVYETPTVKAKAFDYNDSSRRLLESLGFESEGRLRKDAFIDGEYRDAIVYGVLREEWEFVDTN